jgi:hypothetical protein
MKAFTIENESNNIMAHGSSKEAEALKTPSASATKRLWPSWQPTGRRLD